jgi:hypothetical protein
MHWECLGYTAITFVVGYLCGDVFGEPRSAADPAEDGVRGSADDPGPCGECGQAYADCLCAFEVNPKLQKYLRRKAPWEEF